MYYLMPNLRRNTSIASMFEEMEREFLKNPSPTLAFRTDILDEEDRYILKADLPGFNLDEIDIELKDGVLTVSAKHREEQDKEPGKYLCHERRAASYARAFHIEGVQEDQVVARYHNGVLTLTLPKRPEIIPQTRKISIEQA